jgi:hypothetical protein
MRYHVSGGMLMRECEDNMTRKSVDPERPEPTMKNGADPAAVKI